MPGLAEIARAAGVRKEVAEQIFEEILAVVALGAKVNVKCFGTFTRAMTKGRTMSTPLVNDGKRFAYPDKYLIKFKASTLAKRRINVVAKKAAAEALREQKHKKGR